MNSAPGKILVVRTSSLGDILMTTPLVRGLKNLFPQCQVDYLVGARYRELLAFNPYIDNLISLPDNAGMNQTWSEAARLSTNEYDVVVDLHGSLRSRLIRARVRVPVTLTFRKYRLQRAVLIVTKRSYYPDDRSMAQRMLDSVRQLGVDDDGNGLDLFLDPAAEESVGKLAELELPADQSHLIAFAPGARHNTKQWLIEHWSELGKMITANASAAIIVLGGSEDKKIGDEIIADIPGRAFNLAGRLSLMKSAAMISRCHSVITNDSGIMHMAAARQVPVVAIFGPTVRAFGFAPFRVHSRVVEQSLPCRPCSTKGSAKCPLGHFRCMRQTTPQDVMTAYQDLMSSQPNLAKVL
jgi:lipopolysaccharide heptosyltransferase II